MEIEHHLRKQILFNSIKSPDLIEFLVQNTRLMQFENGYYLYQQGNAAVSIFILIKGDMRAVSSDGEYVINSIRKGSGFGEGLLD